MGELIAPIHLLIILVMFVMLAVSIVPYWKIFERAGFSGPLSLLMIVPIANLIVLYVVAFSPWKTIVSSSYYVPPSPSPTPYPLQQPPTDN